MITQKEAIEMDASEAPPYQELAELHLFCNMHGAYSQDRRTSFSKNVDSKSAKDKGLP